jgi:hypothetical protein
MSKKTPDEFSLYVPDEQEPEKDMPAKLEIVDYGPRGKRPKPAMGGGAYDPYGSTGKTGDTTRMRKPRVDLRQLSEWIKATQQVNALKDDGTVSDKDTMPDKD